MRKHWAMMSAVVLLLAGCSNGSSVAESNAPSTTEAVTEAQSTAPETTTEAVEALSVKEMLAAHGMKAGTCVTQGMVVAPMIAGIIKENFNSITFENAMKPDYILDQAESQASGKLSVKINKEMKTVLDWAKKNDMAVRGHTLVWYSQTPEWIFHENFDESKPLVDRDTMLERMESMISQMFAKLDEAGYLDMFYAYDVVNEAWMENGAMRDNNWKKIIGDDYLWQAFYLADKYAPEHVDLYYNDYNEQYKTNTLTNFVQTLVDEDGRYLIDGIGLQAHLYTGDNLPNYFKTIDQLATLGLKVQLTELDVCLGTWQTKLPANEENLAKQGEFYRELIKGILDRVDAGTLKSDALTVWGVSDAMSWRKEASPLLFDEKYDPKPAYYGMLQTEAK